MPETLLLFLSCLYPCAILKTFTKRNSKLFGLEMISSPVLYVITFFKRTETTRGSVKEIFLPKTTM